MVERSLRGGIGDLPEAPLLGALATGLPKKVVATLLVSFSAGAGLEVPFSWGLAREGASLGGADPTSVPCSAPAVPL